MVHNTRVHLSTRFLGENVRLWSETFSAGGSVTKVTVTSDGSVAACKLAFADENGVLG